MHFSLRPYRKLVIDIERDLRVLQEQVNTLWDANFFGLADCEKKLHHLESKFANVRENLSRANEKEQEVVRSIYGRNFQLIMGLLDNISDTLEQKNGLRTFLITFSGFLLIIKPIFDFFGISIHLLPPHTKTT